MNPNDLVYGVNNPVASIVSTKAEVSTTTTDPAEELQKKFFGMINQSMKKTASIQNEVRKNLSELNVSDLLGYKDGIFDTKDGLTMSQRAQDNYYKAAFKDFSNKGLAGLMYATGNKEQATPMYLQSDKEGSGGVSMISRIGEQQNVLASNTSTTVDKAIARQGLRKGFGKVEDIYAGVQSLGQIVPMMVSTLVSADSFASQLASNGMNAIASLSGMRGTQRVSGGGGVAENSKMLLDLLDQLGQDSRTIAEMAKSPDVNEEVLNRMYKNQDYTFKVVTNMLQGLTGITPNVSNPSANTPMYK